MNTLTVVVNIVVQIDGEEVFFHREKELPFLPSVGMTFEFELPGKSEYDGQRRNACFVVREINWIERSGKIDLLLDVHENEQEDLKRSDFSPLDWKEGRYDPWLW